MRSHYVKYLYPYERKHYFGVEDENEEPIMGRKMAKSEGASAK